MSDEVARRRIAEDLGATLLVEAAAGTGKTTALVSRIIAVLRSGAASLGRVIAVTFTEKAAGEMKLRLRGALERARTEAAAAPDEKARLDLALAELEAARIGTIHSVCGDFLRERPVEARVDPLFEVASEDEAARLYDQAFETWFAEQLRQPPEAVRRILRRRAPRRRGQGLGPRQLLRDAGWRLVGRRDFSARWRRDPFERAAAIDVVLARLAEAAALAPRATRMGYVSDGLRRVARFLEELARREAVAGRDYDGLEAELRELGREKLWRWKGTGDWLGPGLLRADALAVRDGAKAALDDAIARADADLAAGLQHELLPLVAQYEELKARAGKLDFLDLLLAARDLVRDHAGVRAELQERFSHIFVDEFQDTDPLQVELLLLLAADDPAVADPAAATPRPGKLFLVGDPRQSIYRFRRADVGLYQATKAQLVGRGAEVVYLTTSFRGVPALQSAVNAAFAPLMQGDGQAEYVALEPARADAAGRPAVIALPVPRPYGDYGKVVNWKIDESLPDAVGAFVDWLVRESRWTVGEGLPLEARHICLLFKRFQSFGEDITRRYVRALEQRRIPHVLVGGRSFHAREEVLALRNALSAIEWPDDELSVFATLRGPLFALGDDSLLDYRHAGGSLHPFRAGPGEVGDALTLLAELHRQRNHRPIADTISRLLAATRAHAGVAIWPAGEQALANLFRVMDLARSFEANGATSFRAFVDRLCDDADEGEAAEAPVVEEGTEGVRVMTVHRAKGLEFPVVILCNPTAPLTPQSPSRHVDPARRLWVEPLAGCTPVELAERSAEVVRRDAEETVRLAYVAATRARDILVVPAVGDVWPSPGGWLSVLDEAIYPVAGRERRAEPAPGCPRFGGDTVLERSPGRPALVPTVAPGLHAPRAGAHRVVWWDPRALRLDAEHDAGLRQQRVLEADEGNVSAEAGERAHAGWQARRRELLERGARPSARVLTATDAGAPALEGDVGHERTDAPRDGRPRGKRFGALVHAVLAVVPLDAGADDVRAAAAAQARLAGAPSDEAEAAAGAALAALRHPLLRRAAAATVRRETPVQLLLDDGALLEGVVNLAFLDAEGWTVVDFKTDGELERARARSEAQVRLYVRAVAVATGRPARGVILAV